MAIQMRDTLGLRLRLARVRLDLSQDALAQMMPESGLNKSSISRFELDQSKPNPDQLVALAKALQTTPNDLLDFGAMGRFLSRAA